MVNWYVWTRAVFAAFGGFTFGYELGYVLDLHDSQDNIYSDKYYHVQRLTV